MFSIILAALSLAAPNIAPQHATYLDPVDEVAAEVCQNHGAVIGAMIRGTRGIAWCADGSIQRFNS